MKYDCGVDAFCVYKASENELRKLNCRKNKHNGGKL